MERDFTAEDAEGAEERGAARGRKCQMPRILEANR
jgi:hypothetical protein